MKDMKIMTFFDMSDSFRSTMRSKSDFASDLDAKSHDYSLNNLEDLSNYKYNPYGKLCFEYQSLLNPYRFDQLKIYDIYRGEILYKINPNFDHLEGVNLLINGI